MTTPYRQMEDVLGPAEREDAAVAALGRWRSSLRTRIMTVFVAAGFVLGLAGYWLLMRLQVELIGVAWLYGGGLGYFVPFAGCCWAGVGVARLIVRQRTPAQIASLSARYQVPADRLAETARLANRL